MDWRLLYLANFADEICFQNFPLGWRNLWHCWNTFEGKNKLEGKIEPAEKGAIHLWRQFNLKTSFKTFFRPFAFLSFIVLFYSQRLSLQLTSWMKSTCGTVLNEYNDKNNNKTSQENIFALSPGHRNQDQRRETFAACAKHVLIIWWEKIAGLWFNGKINKIFSHRLCPFMFLSFAKSFFLFWV